jgi:predicted nucleic acid-binding protein
MIFLDANIVIESIVPGRLKQLESRKLIADESCAISPLTVHLIVHICKRANISSDLAIKAIENLSIVPMNQQTTLWSVNNRPSDFEDALQVGAAIGSGCNAFVTLDRKLARDYGHFIEIKVL